MKRSSYFPRDFTRDYPVVARARGIYIWDTRGRRYIDGSGGAIVVGIGHGESSVSRAVSSQMRRISFAHSSQFTSLPAAELSRKIVGLAGKGFRGAKVYFCSGGSEAVETAVKLARACHLSRGRDSRRIIISRTHSYHGATLGCLNYTGHLRRRAPYEALLDGIGSFTAKIPAAYCYRCPWNLDRGTCAVPCADELEQQILRLGPENVAAFLAEPISGASFAAGVPADRYWPRIREICDTYGVFLIADEVMTGFGRTGANFCMHHWKTIPDMIVMGKGITSGYLPLGGVVVREPLWKSIAEGPSRFEHGFTYHAHPVTCAAGTAVVRLLKDRKLVRAAAKAGRELETELRKLQATHAVIGDVRGLGLMWGIEFVADRVTRRPFPAADCFAGRVRDAAFKRGLIVYPGANFLEDGSGDHIMIAPPFSVTSRQISEIVRLLDGAIKDCVATTLTHDRIV